MSPQPLNEQDMNEQQQVERLHGVPKNRNGSGTSMNSNQRILLVEDYDVNMNVEKTMLEHLDCFPECASNGAEALDLLRRYPFHLVLMDLNMPVMDGYETTLEIRNSLPADKQPRIVIMTSQLTPEECRVLREAGVNGFLFKPLTLQALSGVLDHESAVHEEILQESAGQLLNPESLREIRTFMEPGRIINFLDLFMERSKDNLQQLQQFGISENRERLRELSHKLKSSCGGIGAETLQGLFGQIEAGAQTIGMTELRVMIDRAQDLFEQLVFRLEDVIQQLTRDGSVP